MELTDLNGFTLQITDLEAAIEQADYCKGLTEELPQSFSFKRQLYWQDLYDKLVKLKLQQDEQSSG